MRQWLRKIFWGSSSTDQLDREIAGRQRAEKALREYEAAYRSLVESLPLNLFRKDLGWSHCIGQSAILRIACICRTSEVLGKTDLDLFPSELRTSTAATIVECGDARDVGGHRRALVSTVRFVSCTF